MELDELLGGWRLAAVADGSSEPVDARARKGEDGSWSVVPKGGAAFEVPAGTPVSPDGTLRVPGWLVTTGPASSLKRLGAAIDKMQGLRGVRLLGRRDPFDWDAPVNYVFDRGRVERTGPFSFAFIGENLTVPIPPGAVDARFVGCRELSWRACYGDPPAPFNFDVSYEVAGSVRRRP